MFAGNDRTVAAGPRAVAERSKAACGLEEGAGEPAQLQAGQFCVGEPGKFAELAIAGSRGAVDEPGFVNRGDVGGAVAVGVADLVVGPPRRKAKRSRSQRRASRP